jgi:penicillin-binding protein 1B
MTKARKKKSPGKRTKQKNTSSFSWKKILLGLLLIFIVMLVAYSWYLNRFIQQRFDGDTWARPSRVYARPLELYSGLKLSPEQLMSELRLADYKPVKQVSAVGQFSRSGSIIEFFAKPFQLPGKAEPQPQNHMRIRFNGEQVTEVKNRDTAQQLDFYQLTPALIGSYIPSNGEDRLVVDADQIPDELVDILLAVEDRRFFSHFGVNPLSIMRALMANIRAGKTVQGGSTLTQQLAKNLFLTPERSLIRKINEALLALMLELQFDKKTILAAYINEVFLLQQKNTSVHGFELASKLLFKQPLTGLSTDRLALLVGMVKGPSLYNPITNPKNALKRRNQVLKVLLTDGQITQTAYKHLSNKPLAVVKRLPTVNRFPAYLDLVKKQLYSNYSAQDLSNKGLNIFTAFDPLRQQQLEKGLQQGLNRFKDKEIQSAVIMADYLSGDLVALVGDRDTDYPGYNRAVMAQRPVGSLIKPLLLYGLLKSGSSLATEVEDRPIRIKQSDGKVWAPQNYDKKLHGKMTLYNAFIHSYNLPFVNLGVESGALQTLTEDLDKIHLQKQRVIYPSMLLGALQLTPYEVAQMYQVMANSGYFSPLTTIREVTDDHFQLLTRIPLSSQEVFDRRAMIQLQRAMIGVTEEGTARYLKSRFEEKTFAGKTGTTNDLRDSWFAGFSNRYLTVVWLGNDENHPTGLTGSSGALRVWADIMNRVDDSSLKLSPDPELEWIYVDKIKGGKTQKGCESSALLPFEKGKQPDFSSECKQDFIDRGIRWLQDHF